MNEYRWILLAIGTACLLSSPVLSSSTRTEAICFLLALLFGIAGDCIYKRWSFHYRSFLVLGIIILSRGFLLHGLLWYVNLFIERYSYKISAYILPLSIENSQGLQGILYQTLSSYTQKDLTGILMIGFATGSLCSLLSRWYDQKYASSYVKKTITSLSIVLACVYTYACPCKGIYESIYLLSFLLFLFYWIMTCRKGLSATYRSHKLVATIKGLLPVGICSLIIIALITAVINNILPTMPLKANHFLMENLHKAVYGEDSLSYGILSGHLDKSDKENRLIVTMDQPQSLYLRGYVGSNYTGKTFEPLSSETNQSYGPLAYWLNHQGFSDAVQLGDVELLLKDDADIQEISIENQSADKSYIYLPYESVQSLNETSSWTMNGMVRSVKKSSVYNVKIASKSMKEAYKLAAMMEEGEEVNELITIYSKASNHYNQWVYEELTRLPEDTRQVFYGVLGSVNYQTMHMPYDQAKEQVFSWLADYLHYDASASCKLNKYDLAQQMLLHNGNASDIQYAAMTVLFYRYLGIPARYVEGYVITRDLADTSIKVKNESADSKGQDDNVKSTLILTDQSAHAWAEIYQDGLGWLPVETCPGYMNAMEQPDYISFAASDQEDTLQKKNRVGDLLEEEEPASDQEGILLVTGLIIFTLLNLLILFLCLVIKIRKECRIKAVLKQLKGSFHDSNRNSAVKNLGIYLLYLLRFPLGTEYETEFQSISDLKERLDGVEVNAYGTSSYPWQTYIDGLNILEESLYSPCTLKEESYLFVLKTVDDLETRVLQNPKWKKQLKQWALTGFITFCLLICWNHTRNDIQTAYAADRYYENLENAFLATDHIQECLKESLGLSEDYSLLKSLTTEEDLQGLEWYVVALSRLGQAEDYSAYLSSLSERITDLYSDETYILSSRATEWHRYCYGILAAGGDPTAFAKDKNGNFINLVADGVWFRTRIQELGWQGLNAYSWALICIDSLHYKEPEDALDGREKIISCILSEQLSNGAFSLDGEGGDVDITAMMLQALAPYYNNEKKYKLEFVNQGGLKKTVNVRTVVDQALTWLSQEQQADGDFKSVNVANAESTCQVLTALCSLNLDPLTEDSFIKNGNTVLDGLMKYQLSDGGFTHTYERTEVESITGQAGEMNNMATVQAFYALVAFERNQLKMRHLYDFREEMEVETADKISAFEDKVSKMSQTELEKCCADLLEEYKQIPANERSYVSCFWQIADACQASGYAVETDDLVKSMDEGGQKLSHGVSIRRYANTLGLKEWEDAQLKVQNDSAMRRQLETWNTCLKENKGLTAVLFVIQFIVFLILCKLVMKVRKY